MDVPPFALLFFGILTLALYYSIPARMQDVLLLLVSYGLILLWDRQFALLLFLITLFHYLYGPWLYKKRQKQLLFWGIMANVLVLLFFRSVDYFIPQFIKLLGTQDVVLDAGTIQILMPLGISFYTLQNISYLADVYRGQISPITNFTSFALYLTYFPELIAGPIEYARNFIPNLENRIAGMLRGRGVGRAPRSGPVTNVALVWHSAAYATHRGQPLEAWYPGDDVVDWVAVSWFAWPSPEDDAIAAAARDRVAAFARRHRKPLMIAEAAPKAYFPADAPDAWTGWHAKVFAWIEQNDVKAYSYINQDWNAMPQWRAGCAGGGDWGDTRVQKPGRLVLETWRDETRKLRWLKQDPGLFPAIGFVPEPR